MQREFHRIVGMIPNCIGLTKVRNEERIMQDTLDHVATFAEGIVIYDDCSTDSTVEIAKAHPAVLAVVEGEFWDPVRFNAERDTRQAALTKAREFNPEWLFCFDADERFVFPEDWSWTARQDGLKMRLFDAYITPEDVDLPYTERRWFGPEYRDILMAYRNFSDLNFTRQDQREMIMRGRRVLQAGWVKHYGKAESVEQWEETCEYYATHFPEPYRSKWDARRGKAVKHDMKSDFGAPLMLWEERDDKGFPL
jgi:glycosyltransferase involved in cell wall biosynthesis